LPTIRISLRRSRGPEHTGGIDLDTLPAGTSAFRALPDDPAERADMGQAWPTGDIDALQRLRVLTVAVHAPMYAEEVLEAPLDRVWSVAGDLEAELPHLISSMRSFTVLDRTGDGEFRARAVSTLGTHADFDVVLQPGWCLMQSRYVIGGMAAVPAGEHTRFAVLGATRLVRGRPATRLLGPAGRALGRRMIGRLRRRLAA